MMVRLFESSKINLLRDLRQLQDLDWLLPEEYLAFLAWYSKFKNDVFKSREFLKEFGVTPDEFLASLSKKRPANNFNPDNKLRKRRHPWSADQIKRLKNLR